MGDKLGRVRQGYLADLLVVQGDRLYEAYRANAVGSDGLEAQCLAVWQLERIYPASNRGEHCTSADAARDSSRSTRPGVRSVRW